MKIVEATYQVITPLFLGGANVEEKTPELRPPALKGLLRFWFRAVALPQFNTWPAVWEAERSLFGSTAGQASFSLSVNNQSKFTVVPVGEQWHKHGAAYLGYGVVDKGKTVRPYLKPDGSFTVRLVLKKGVPEQDITLLIQALKALGLFGGAGARSRKGFGSLSLKSLRLNGRETWCPPTDAASLCQVIREFFREIGIDRARKEIPAYTAFSPEARICIAQTGRDAFQLLDEIGKELLRYRSYGRSKGDKHVLPWGEDAEQNFAGDHDIIQEYLNGRRITRHPRRVVFGLPHNYFFQSIKQKAAVEAKNYTRRASPLFIHIHALDRNGYASVMTLLPAAFLPEGEQIAINCPDRRARLQPVYVDQDIDYEVINCFFERPAFNAKRVVWP